MQKYYNIKKRIRRFDFYYFAINVNLVVSSLPALINLTVITSPLLYLYKVYLKDTQTGLRAIPNRLIKVLVKVDGSRFEYELNALIKLVKMKEEIIQHDIKTVYLKNSNKKSHYKVLRDSYQIYKIMFQRRKDSQ